MDPETAMAASALRRLAPLLVAEVKKKRTLHALSDAFVLEQAQPLLTQAPVLRLASHPNVAKSRDFRRLVKHVRERLHEVYGVFQKRKKDLTALKVHLGAIGVLDAAAVELHRSILACHHSTQERLPFYPEMYEQIFRLTGTPRSILDLGAGLNPLSYPFMNLHHVRYTAVELTEEDCRFLQDYFAMMRPVSPLEGQAVVADLTKPPEFSAVDVCFLFKILDTLETLRFDASRALLPHIQAKHLVVSFPTRTLCGRKPIRSRGWFLKLLREFKCVPKVLDFQNERFYIIPWTGGS